MAEKEKMLVAITHYGNPLRWDCLILLARGIWVEEEFKNNPFGDWKHSPLNGEEDAPTSGLWIVEMEVDCDDGGFYRHATEWRRPTLDEMAHVVFNQLEDLWGPPVTELELKRQQEKEQAEYSADKKAAEEQGICMECLYGAHNECTMGGCVCTHQFKD